MSKSGWRIQLFPSIVSGTAEGRFKERDILFNLEYFI